MSRSTAQAAFHSLTAMPAFVAPEFVSEVMAGMAQDDLRPSVVSALQQLQRAAPTEEATRWQARREEIAANYGAVAGPSEKPFVFFDGIAVIPVHGLLINRFPYCWGFVTGYNFIRAQHQAARQDPDVKLIVLDVDSCGGMKPGADETSQDIFDHRADKPTIALVDYSCFSAAYYVASAASKVICTPSGYAGSIGALCMRLDVTEALSKSGIKLNVVYAGEQKVDSHPAVPFTDDMRARYQADVDACMTEFVAAIVRNRGMTEEAVRATKAGCFDAVKSLELGLIDGIAPTEQAIENAVAALDAANGEDAENDDNNQKDEPDMTTKPAETTANQPDETALADARKAGAVAAQARISGILACDEAKGRTKLANHLAFHTELDVSAAKAMLAVAEPEAKAEAAPASGKTGTGFSESMDNARQPNLKSDEKAGGEGGDDGEDADEKATKAILGSQNRATGTMHKIN